MRLNKEITPEDRRKRVDNVLNDVSYFIKIKFIYSIDCIPFS